MTIEIRCYEYREKGTDQMTGYKVTVVICNPKQETPFEVLRLTGTRDWPRIKTKAAMFAAELAVAIDDETPTKVRRFHLGFTEPSGEAIWVEEPGS